MTFFNVLWFFLIFVLIGGYFVLDGFDLGAGVLYPFVAKDDREKAVVRRSIGPVWDGNEVWLLTAGGALFAAFAEARKEQKNPMAGCGPVVDGVFLTESAAEAAKAGRQKNIPYLMGSTSEDVVPPIVHKMAKGWARLQADQGKQPSYAYFFSRQLPGDEKGAWHSADLWYAFGTLDSCWRPFTEWDRALSEAMVSYLTNFAKTGDPNGPGLAEWLPVKKGQTQVLRFGDRDITMGGVSVARLTHTMLTKPNVGE